MGKKTTIRAVILIIASITIIILSVLYLNNYELALMDVGFHSYASRVVDTGIDDNGNEYRVLAESLIAEEAPLLVYMVKGPAGIWKVEYTSGEPIDGSTFLSWSRASNLRRYETTDTDTVEWESHLLYSGDNAVKRITIPPDELPPNVTVSIYQAGSDYLLHFIHFGSVEVMNQIHVQSLLSKAGCISTSLDEAPY